MDLKPQESEISDKIGMLSWAVRYKSRVAAGFSNYHVEFRMPLVLAHGSPIFHSSCEGKLGIALE